MLFNPDRPNSRIKYFDDGRVALLGYIVRDITDALNPRKEWDNFGTMTCWSRHFLLGDEHKFPDVRSFLMDIAKNLDPDFDADADHTKEYLFSIFDEYTYNLPLYLYNHSSLAISSVPFSDPWDSGQCGYIYVPKGQASSEYNHAEHSDGYSEEALRTWALSLLKAEVDTYNAYLQGDVWGVCFETYYDARRPEDTGPVWVRFHSANKLNIEESVWGYYGENEALEIMNLEFTAYEKIVKDILANNKPCKGGAKA